MVISFVRLDAEEDGRTLSAILEVLSPPDISQPMHMEFKEARSYPFRRYPKDFEGSILLEPDGAILVQYRFPSEYTIKLTDEGVELIENNGSRRDLGSPPALALLRELLQWDVEAIDQQWALDSVKAEGTKRIIKLDPASTALKKALSSITLTLDSERVYEVRVQQKDNSQRNYVFGTLSPIEAEDAQ